MDDADGDAMQGAGSRKRSTAAGGWQGWSKYAPPPPTPAPPATFLRAITSRFDFVSAPAPASHAHFEPLIAQHKDAPRSTFVMPRATGVAVAAGGFGSQWTTIGDAGNLGA